MNQFQVEKRLCWSYTVVTLLLLTSVISIAIPYNHWKLTLDVCPGSWLENTNCGCIFFGVSTFQYFNGGHNAYCLYATFAPLAAIGYAVAMAVFHMYRVCINNIGEFEDEKSKSLKDFNESTEIVLRTRTRVAPRNDGIIYCWIPKACIAAIFAVYTLVHASIITHGFIRTCNEYRLHLINKDWNPTGQQATVIRFRLSCSAILDFMDYLLQNSPNSRRNEFINTGASLQIAIVAAWLAVAVWIVIIVLAAKRAYNVRDVLTCCGN